MRIASYRKDTKQSKLTGKEQIYSAEASFVAEIAALRGAFRVYTAQFLNHLTEKGKPIVRWGRKAIGSTIDFVDSLAAEANGIICSLFLPAVPVFRLVCLIEKGERNDKT